MWVKEFSPPFRVVKGEEGSAFALVLVEQKSLRAAARERCRRALAAMEKLRNRLGVFEREDRPAFHQWLAREFGRHLTAARDLEDAIRAQQELVRDVEEEILRTLCDPATAYQRVRLRTTNPERAAEEDRRRAEAAPKTGVHLSDSEQEEVFKNWLRENFGVHAEAMDGVAFRINFGNFRVHLFGELPEEEHRRNFPSLPMPCPRMVRAYRVLVRRLHPDRRGDGSAQASWLWHEVQHAYGARDLERLETLLAFTELDEEEWDAQTPLFQLRAVRRELRQTLRALRQSLRAAATEDAWQFAKRSTDNMFRARVGTALEENLAGQRRTLDYLTNLIAQWEKPVPPSEYSASIGDGNLS